jgi:hypothetical protein
MTAAKATVAVTYAPEGLSRSEAARYVCLGETSFDDAVKAGIMPKARRYPHVRRLVWLKRELDRALEDLPVDGVQTTDEYDGVRF